MTTLNIYSKPIFQRVFNQNQNIFHISGYTIQKYLSKYEAAPKTFNNFIAYIFTQYLSNPEGTDLDIYFSISAGFSLKKVIEVILSSLNLDSFYSFREKDHYNLDNFHLNPLDKSKSLKINFINIKGNNFNDILSNFDFGVSQCAIRFGFREVHEVVTDQYKEDNEARVLKLNRYKNWHEYFKYRYKVGNTHSRLRKYLSRPLYQGFKSIETSEILEKFENNTSNDMILLGSNYSFLEELQEISYKMLVIPGEINTAINTLGDYLKTSDAIKNLWFVGRF